jgi:uncharacterized Fe-S center protein
LGNQNANCKRYKGKEETGRKMKGRVYFVPVDDTDDIGTTNEKLKSLIAESAVLDIIRRDDRVAVKAHFGEKGNTGYVRPQHTVAICRDVTSRCKDAFLSDTNTLYRGERLNSRDHLAIAAEHGFTKETMGMDIIVPDDNIKKEVSTIRLKETSIKAAKVARIFVEADAIVAVTHFQGHILTGFGGALKNIGMGCATREGKLAQHCDVSPVFYADKCTGCGECEKVCPANAIRIEGKKAALDTSKCIGCASCMAACPNYALFIDWEAGDRVQKKMVEYSLAVLKDKRGKAAFFNFATRINRECDCWGEENERIAPDVGIFASLDPVAIDKASFDVVNRACGRDVFREAHPKQDGMRQLKYAEDLGMGSLDYELKEL